MPENVCAGFYVSQVCFSRIGVHLINNRLIIGKKSIINNTSDVLFGASGTLSAYCMEVSCTIRKKKLSHKIAYCIIIAFDVFSSDLLLDDLEAFNSWSRRMVIKY